jgi:hypothetical protein
MSMSIGTFEQYSSGLNPSENEDVNVNPDIIEKLVDLVGSEDEVEAAAKEAFEELQKSFDENEVELKEGDAPETLAMSALILKLVETGKLGPQEADSFIEENLVDMASGENEESESEEEIKEDVNLGEHNPDTSSRTYKVLAGFVQFIIDKGGENKSIEEASALAELSIYYENLRDGITPKTLSKGGQAARNIVERDIMKYSGAQLKKFEEMGTGKTTIVR